jgi:hypothetical protein
MTIKERITFKMHLKKLYLKFNIRNLIGILA